MNEQSGRELSEDRRVAYQLHADRERRAEPARDTMRCSLCRQYVPISTHLCPAEMDQLRAALDAHYAEHPHARPTDEQVAQALREQTGDEPGPPSGDAS